MFEQLFSNFITNNNEIYLTEITYNGLLLYLFHIIYSVVRYYKRFDNLFFLIITICQIVMYDDYRSFVPLSIFTLIAIIQHMLENKDRISEQLKINSMSYEINKDNFVKLKDIKLNERIHLNFHKDIPADIQIESGKLVVNEYNLTGEKVDIVKYKDDIIYRGTNIIDGDAIGFVIEVGNSCKIYNINYDIKEKISWIEYQLYKLCLNNLYVLFGMSIFFSIIIYLKYSINKFLHLLLLFNTLIPLSLQFFLNCSSQIISKRIEKYIDIKINQHGIKSFQFDPKFIVTDKTGTITTNKIELNNIYANFNFSKNFNQLAINIISSSMIDLHSVTKKILKNDILEELLFNYLDDNGIKLIENNVNKYNGNLEFINKNNIINNPEKIKYNRHYYENLIYVYGVKISIISTRNTKNTEDEYYMHIQGMPESIYKYISEKNRKIFNEKLHQIENISNDNYYLRIIAHAYKKITKKEFKDFISSDDNDKIKFLINFTSWSIYVFEDYIVDGLKNTFKKLDDTTELDITMLTGDKFTSSINVGKLIGLIDDNYIHITDIIDIPIKKYNSILISGSVLENIIKNDKELFKILVMFSNKKIIYRATPNLKQLYVTTLQECFNKDVMMIGDGMNDISAIISSNIGVGIIGENDVVQKISDVVIKNWNCIPNLLNQSKKMQNITINLSKYVLLKHITTAFCLCSILILSDFTQVRDPFGPYIMAIFNSIIFVFGMLYAYYTKSKNMFLDKKIDIKYEYIYGIILGLLLGFLQYILSFNCSEKNKN